MPRPLPSQKQRALRRIPCLPFVFPKLTITFGDIAITRIVAELIDLEKRGMMSDHLDTGTTG